MRLYLPIIPTIQKCQTHRKNADGKQNTGLNLLSGSFADRGQRQYSKGFKHAHSRVSSRTE